MFGIAIEEFDSRFHFENPRIWVCQTQVSIEQRDLE